MKPRDCVLTLIFPVSLEEDLVDHLLEDGNGHDFVQGVRETDLDVPILVVSGAFDIEALTGFVREAIDDVLAKPIDFTKLSDVTLTGCRIGTLDLAGATTTRVAVLASLVDDLDARHRTGNHLDLRGLDVVRIREVAQQRGLLSAKEAALLDENESYQLLLRPGFSTKEEITALSGRGVGLDVVSTTVRKLHGTLGIESAPGAGTTFTISVPLTVAASRVLMLEEQDHTFALPLPAIARIALPRREELATLGSQTVFYIDGQPHTVLRLSKLIGQTHTGEAPARQPLLQLRGSGGVVIACDRLRGEADLVLRPLPIELRRYPLLSSVAIVPSGPALFVLSPQGLLATATSLRLAQENLSRRRTVLVADDSITTRSLLRSVLEGGGYRVRTASDGDEALRIARSERIDLVVSDVRMPRLDGIGLLLRLRGDARTSRLPLVLFSGAQSEEDRLRGLAAGASAYLAKSDFERGQLVDVVTQLLKEEAT